MDEVQVSIVIRNYATVAALLLVGSWAFWKWSFSEWLRRMKEVPSVDGELSTQFEPLNNGKIILSLRAIWRNCGENPVHIDHENVRVDVFLIPQDLPVGPINPKKDLGTPTFTIHPFLDMPGYVLEPQTDSLIKTHFVLEEEQTYFFRWKWYRSTKEHSNVVYAWTKELVYKTTHQ